MTFLIMISAPCQVKSRKPIADTGIEYYYKKFVIPAAIIYSLFIDIRNSSFDLVLATRSRRNSIDSTGFISER